MKSFDDRFYCGTFFYKYIMKRRLEWKFPVVILAVHYKISGSLKCHTRLQLVTRWGGGGGGKRGGDV